MKAKFQEMSGGLRRFYCTLRTYQTVPTLNPNSTVFYFIISFFLLLRQPLYTAPTPIDLNGAGGLCMTVCVASVPRFVKMSSAAHQRTHVSAHFSDPHLPHSVSLPLPLLSGPCVEAAPPFSHVILLIFFICIHRYHSLKYYPPLISLHVWFIFLLLPSYFPVFHNGECVYWTVGRIAGGQAWSQCISFIILSQPTLLHSACSHLHLSPQHRSSYTLRQNHCTLIHYRSFKTVDNITVAFS